MKTGVVDASAMYSVQGKQFAFSETPAQNSRPMKQALYKANDNDRTTDTTHDDPQSKAGTRSHSSGLNDWNSVFDFLVHTYTCQIFMYTVIGCGSF